MAIPSIKPTDIVVGKWYLYTPPADSSGNRLEPYRVKVDDRPEGSGGRNVGSIKGETPLVSSSEFDIYNVPVVREGDSEQKNVFSVKLDCLSELENEAHSE